MFQSYALNPHMTVRENMGFSLHLRKADAATTAKRVDNAARILNLDASLDRYPRELSGGHYGIRPTDLCLGSQGIAARVVVIEPTGAETELLVEVGGQQLVLVMHGRTQARPDDTVYLQLDADMAHVFDTQGGQRL